MSRSWRKPLNEADATGLPNIKIPAWRQGAGLRFVGVGHEAWSSASMITSFSNVKVI